MFSREKIEQHLQLIRSALKFSGKKGDIFNTLMYASTRDERLGKTLHYGNGKTSEWTCYFTNPDMNWALSIIHPLSWEEIIPLFYFDKYHESCDKADENDVDWVIMTLMIDNKFIASRQMCPEAMAFITTRFHDKNVCNYEELSTLWERNIGRIPSHLDTLKQYADGKKVPFTC